MAVNRYSRPRTRPVPTSKVSRDRLFTRILAEIHDAWIATRFRQNARRELTILDDRILEDIGVTRATIREVSTGENVPHTSLHRTARANSSETTFLPHCERDVA
ncbi:MAG: DUF1127 domain-containing protein [Alphaproteobacteria bacterium]|nr:DUF1127 domain-containing protein [Alphaproteobacteria bacterium]